MISISFLAMLIQYKVIDSTFQASPSLLVEEGNERQWLFHHALLYDIFHQDPSELFGCSKSNFARSSLTANFTLSSSSAPTGTLSAGMFGRVVVNSVNFASISANSAPSALTSAERVCTAAIFFAFFPLFRLVYDFSRYGVALSLEAFYFD